jgi:hypothetical protein
MTSGRSIGTEEDAVMFRRQGARTRFVCALAIMGGCLSSAWFVIDHQPVYEASGTVVLIPAESTAVNSELRWVRDSMVVTGRALVLSVNDGNTRVEMIKKHLTPCQNTLLDRGNQWVPINDTPTIVISCTSRRPSEADSAMKETINRISSDLSTWQDSDNIPAASRLVTSSATHLQHQSSAGETKVRALAAILVVTIGLLCALFVTPGATLRRGASQWRLS